MSIMPMMNKLRYTLLIITLSAAYLLFITSFPGGLMNFLDEILSQKELLGAPKDSWITNYTGIEVVDNFVQIYVLMLWPATCGHPPPKALHFIGTMISVVSTWLLIILEACRTRPLTHIMPRMVAIGSTVSLLGSGVTLPFHMALLLPSSVNPACENCSGNSDGEKINHHRCSHQVAASSKAFFPSGLASSAILGFTLAAVPMFIPAPTIVSYEFKQRAILWSLISWPFSIASLTWVTSRFSKNNEQGVISRLDAIISHPRSICAQVFVLSSIPHIAIIICCLAATLGLFGPQNATMTFDRCFHMLFPSPPWSTPASIVDASYLFLQWDYILTFASAFTWSFGLYIQTCQQEKLSLNYTRLALEILVLLILVGPMPTATVFTWKRDVILNRAPSTELKDE